MTTIDLSVMTFDAAKALFVEIRAAQDNWMELVIQAHDGKAWAAVGYNSWAECVRREFPISKRHADRIICFSEVQKALADVVGPIGPTCESQARPLTTLETPGEQREAWTAATETAAAAGAPVTAKVVKAAVAKVRAKRNGTAAAPEPGDAGYQQLFKHLSREKPVEPPPHAPDPTDPKDEPPGPNDPEPNYPALSLLRMNWDAAKGDERLSAIEYFWANMAVTFQAAVLKYFWLKASPEQRDEFRKYQEAQP